MNIYTQTRGFYSIVFNGEKEIRPVHVSLYFFLLNQANRSKWIEWFKVPFDTAMHGACINSNKTYYKVLNDLQDFGFIEYEKGKNNFKAPKIKIVELSNNEEKMPAPEVDSSVEITQLSTLLSKQLGTQLDTQHTTYLCKQLSTHKRILVTSNYKLVISNKEEDVILPFDSEEFSNAWDCWKEYKKKDHRFSYKSGSSEQISLKSLVDLSNGDEAKALQIIEQSIANSWKGFFPLKNQQNGNSKKGFNAGNFDIKALNEWANGE